MMDNRLKGFTDAEIYIIKRAFTESSYEFFMMDKYEKPSRDMHTKLFNEFVNEDRKRLYGKAQGE